MWLSFCYFFAPQGPSWPEGGFWLKLKRTVLVDALLSLMNRPRTFAFPSTKDPRRRPRRDAEVRILTVRTSPRELRGGAGGTFRLLERPAGHRWPAPVAENARRRPRRDEEVRIPTVRPSASRAPTEATPAVLDGSENGPQAADGPLLWPPTRSDLPCTTSASFQLAPRLRHACVARHHPNSVRMFVWAGRTRSKQKESPQRDSNQFATG